MIENVLVVGLASFAISYILRYTDGPWEVFYRMRSRIGVVYDPMLQMDVVEVEWVGAYMVACFWCFTTWVSLFVAILYALAVQRMEMVETIFLWLATVGVSGFLKDIIRPSQEE